MFQASITYTSDEWLRRDLKHFAREVDSRGAHMVLLNMVLDQVDPDLQGRLAHIAADVLPDAEFCGFSVNGLIGQGQLLRAHAQIVCMAFEQPDTQVQVLQFPATEDTLVDAAAQMVSAVSARPWVKGVALYVSVRSIDVAPLCGELDKLDPQIQVFGGGAQNRNIASDHGCVFSKHGSFMEDGIVAVLLGGPDLHLTTLRVGGWRPLGKRLVSTCEGSVLTQLGDRPAFDVYSHYLGIDNDEDFYNNALEFPLMFDDAGVRIARVPTSAHPDGSLSLAFPVRSGSVARIAYGDPQAIEHELQIVCGQMCDFQPQGIFLFDCASRRKFWGDDDCSIETRVFQAIAPTGGGYLRGEFRRTGGRVYLNNLTIVALGLREGPTTDDPKFYRVNLPGGTDERKRSTVYRLANFVNVATTELEQVNRQLRHLADTDQLTLTLNRAAVEARIGREVARLNRLVAETSAEREGAGTAKDTADLVAEESLAAEWAADGPMGNDPSYDAPFRSLANRKPTLSLIMFDIDDYKLVNDRFGHAWGDELLRVLATLMRGTVNAMNPQASLGRWGGDEFMAVLPGTDLARAREIAETVRSNFEQLKLGPVGAQTLSIGVIEVVPGEDAHMALQRVDRMLYRAKNTGKNRIFS